MYKKFIFNFCLLMVSFSLSSQEQNELSYAEEGLHEMFEELFQTDGTKFTQTDSIKLSLSNEISEKFNEILFQKESFKYPFKSLRRIGIRYSDDKLVKIYTWSIKLENGDHLYYGFIQKRDRKKLRVYQLKDDALNMKADIEYLQLDHKHWYGVNYYKIIDFKYRGRKIYALLGARNNTYVSKTKVIEILSFSGKRAKLGKRVFGFNKNDDPIQTKRKQQRILMEYNHNVSMVMNYDKKLDMIVFDHLSPEDSKLKDIRRFYGPDGSYDAFQFNGYKWKYIPNQWAVNKRNRVQEKLNNKQEDVDLYTR